MIFGRERQDDCLSADGVLCPICRHRGIGGKKPRHDQVLDSANGGQIGNRRSGLMRYPVFMEHLEVLREKIGRLRLEIAQIQELNRVYRLQVGNDTEAQVAHGQRHERLQAIQHELAQLATLGSRVRSVAEMKESHRSRLQLVKKAS